MRFAADCLLLRRFVLTFRFVDINHFSSPVLGYSTPIVPFNEKQELTMNSKLMTELLQRIGFLPPNGPGKIYFRIPDFFTPEIVYKLAAKLSKVNSGRLFYKADEILACSQ